MKGLSTEMGGAGETFPPTRMSLLARALRSDPAVRREAWDVLLTTCWKPLYAFVRAQGSANEEAKDLVQDFCVHLLDKGFLAKYDPALGRFRYFLIGHLRGFLSDRRDHERAQKRGGGRRALPIEEEALSKPDPGEGPHAAFDRAWVRGLIDRAFQRWAERIETTGKRAWVPLVERLRKYGYGKLPPIAELARELGATEAQVRHFLHRGKAVLREEIIAEVRAGVSSDAEAKDELRDLRDLFGAMA